MKKALYVLGGLVLVVLLVALGGILYLQSAFPQVSPAENLAIEATPERLERGAYLVNHVSLCMDCHSRRDYNFFPPKIVEGSQGGGGELFPGVPGTLYNANITPAALGDWTDGEIARAITCGVDKDDNMLVPMMPFNEYRYMATEDVHAVVAYLRALKPIQNEMPETEMDFPFNLIFRTVPGDADPQPLPDISDAVATGKYLARIAGCYFCHSPVEQGTPIPGQDFAGGHEFDMAEMGIVRASNLTPDMETGIGRWSKEIFVARFKAYADSSFQPKKITPGKDMQTAMPWQLLAGMTEADLGAIYEYLRTLKPIANSVEKFTAAK